MSEIIKYTAESGTRRGGRDIGCNATSLTYIAVASTHIRKL